MSTELGADLVGRVTRWDSDAGIINSLVTVLIDTSVTRPIARMDDPFEIASLWNINMMKHLAG